MKDTYTINLGGGEWATRVGASLLTITNNRTQEKTPSAMDCLRTGLTTRRLSDRTVEKVDAKEPLVTWVGNTYAQVQESAATMLLENTTLEGAVSGLSGLGVGPTGYTSILNGDVVVLDSYYPGDNKINYSGYSDVCYSSQVVYFNPNSEYFVSAEAEATVSRPINTYFKLTPPTGTTMTYYLNGVVVQEDDFMPLGLHTVGISASVGSTGGDATLEFGVLNSEVPGSVTIDLPQVTTLNHKTSYIRRAVGDSVPSRGEPGQHKTVNLSKFIDSRNFSMEMVYKDIPNSGRSKQIRLTDEANNERFVLRFPDTGNQFTLLVNSNGQQIVNDTYAGVQHDVLTSYKVTAAPEGFKVYIDGVLAKNIKVENTLKGLGVLDFNYGANAVKGEIHQIKIS